MANAGDLFADGLTELQLDVAAFERKVLREVQGQFSLLAQELEADILSGGLDSTSSQFLKVRRTAEIIRQAEKTIKDRIAKTGKLSEVGVRQLSQFSRVAIVDVVNEVFKVDFLQPLSVQRVKALANNQIVLGGTAQEHWAKQTVNLRHRFATQVRVGAAAGETSDQIVRRIRGRATGKRIAVRIGGKTKMVHEFSGGIMDVSTRDARTLVRTSLNNISNEVYHDTYQANGDVLKGEMAIATLDSGTTPVCMARDHGAWDLEGDPLPESATNEPFPGPPPWHMRCRTVLSPLTKSWQELADEAAEMNGTRGVKIRTQMDKVPMAGRSSIDGRIAASTDWDQFLKRKGDAWARQKLGPARFELWKEGRVTLAQMIDQSGKTRTIAQLQQIRKPSRIVPPA